MQRLRITFRKGEGARFLSHLDLMAMFEYALRRAGLPVELSEGFNPRPRMSAAAPLPVGYVGERELIEITLRAELPEQEVLARLQAALPAGVTLRSLEVIPPGQKSAASRLHSAGYRVELPEPIPDLQDRIEALLAKDRLVVEEVHNGTTRARDLRPLLLSLEPLESRGGLHLTVRLDSGGTARPEQVLDLLDIPRDGARIIRERIELDEKW